jgi:hypothetical protein
VDPIFFRSLRRVRLVTALLLVLQAGWLAAPVWAMACGTEKTQAADEDDCCAGLHPGQMCPMHRHRAGQDHTPPLPIHDAPVKLRASCEPSDPLLDSLMLGLGELISPAVPSLPERTATRQPYTILMLSIVVPPAFPPPRLLS